MSERRDPEKIARLAALILSIALVFGFGVVIIMLASTAVLTILVSVLLAIMFDSGARGLGLLVNWPRRIRLVIVFLLAIGLILGGLWWGGTTVFDQATQFAASMRDLLTRGAAVLERNGIAPSNSIDLLQMLPKTDVIFGGATKVVSTIFGAVSMVTAILFLGAFLSWEPSVYKAAIISVFPREKRARLDQVMDQAADAMREWMVGQSVSMVVTLIFTMGTLITIGMPYPVLLAIQAAALVFIPTIGPIVAGGIIILAGLSHSLTMALYGFGTYVVIQFLETNLVTPLVQKRTIHLPPAFTLGIQLVAGFLFGVLGLAFAVPLAAAGKVFVEELYVKDSLGGTWEPNS